MKKGVLLVSLATCLVLAGCGDDNATAAADTKAVISEVNAESTESTEITENTESTESTETYYAVIKCVDDMFYDGGYDVGDTTREAIMNDALALFKQPKYDESKVDGVDRGALDMAKYMDSYSTCLSEDIGNKIISIAKSHGMEMMSEE